MHMNTVNDDHHALPPTPAWYHPVKLAFHRKLDMMTALLLITLLGGCGSASELKVVERFENGYIIILPGVEGKSHLNVNIAKGLAEGGVQSAIEIYDWTAFRWLTLPYNLRGLDRNKREARKIARKIMEYQDQFPGKPVHLIGHSGGGGVALLVLEALPYQRKINSAILLAPAVTPRYDLRRALRRTEQGIWNFYSPHDVGFLKLGTTVMGTIDGDHTTAAGAVGFSLPWGLDREGRMLYGAKLHQQRYNHKMASSGHSGGHFGWADRKFVSEWLAPIIMSQDKPLSEDKTQVETQEQEKSETTRALAP